LIRYLPPDIANIKASRQGGFHVGHGMQSFHFGLKEAIGTLRHQRRPILTLLANSSTNEHLFLSFELGGIHSNIYHIIKGEIMAALEKPMNKTELLTELANTSGLDKKDITNVLDALGSVIQQHIQKSSVGSFTLPGLLKINAVEKPAQAAKTGVPNPFRPGETMDVAAKPASVKVKVLPLKNLKDMVA